MPPRLVTCRACTRVRPGVSGLCLECTAARKAKRERERARHRQQPIYDADWRRMRDEIVGAHIARFGLHCPMCDRMVEQARDMTLDHVKPGSLDEGVRVMCRRCNSRLGAEHGNRIRGKA